MDKFIPLELWSIIYKKLNDYDRFKLGMCSRQLRNLVYIIGYEYIYVNLCRPKYFQASKIIVDRSIPINILEYVKGLELKGKRKSIVNNLIINYLKGSEILSAINYFNPKEFEANLISEQEREILKLKDVKEKKHIYKDISYEVFQYPGHFLTCHVRSLKSFCKLQIKDVGHLEINNTYRFIIKNNHPDRDILEVHEYGLFGTRIIAEYYRDKNNNYHHPTKPAHIHYYNKFETEYIWYCHGEEIKTEWDY